MAMVEEQMEAEPVELKPTVTALTKLKKAQLAFELKKRDLDTTGLKDVLVRRLLAALTEPPAAVPAEEVLQSGSESCLRPAMLISELAAEIAELSERLKQLDSA
eukprot:scaffold112666_cov37-Prasinocladus_malaysianus.AAC.1